MIISKSILVSTNGNVSLYIPFHIYMYVYIYVCVCVYMCVCVCVCVCMCMYICTTPLSIHLRHSEFKVKARLSTESQFFLLAIVDSVSLVAQW